MIMRELYTEKMREAKLLLNAAILTAAVDAIYDRIKDKYIQQDFEYAIEALIERGDKISYPALKKYLERYKQTRLDAERQRDKMKESREKRDISKCPAPIAEMVKAYIDRNSAALEKFDMKQPFLKGNAVIIAEDGRRKDAIVDCNDEAFIKSLIRSKEQNGENITNVAYISKETKYIELSKHEISTPATAYRDSDFIPEQDDLPEAEGWGY